tara:strand:- start:3958 stop:5535 length:1578 start_codon:yes stop_codon:yes gene_type:complete
MKTITFLFVFLFSLLSHAQEYKLIHSTKSLVGTHTLYHPTFKGLPIFNQFLKQNVFNNEIQNYYTDIELIPSNRDLLTSDTILKSEPGFLNKNGEIIPVSAKTVIDKQGKSYTLYINNEFKTLHHLNHNLNLKDTTIVATVFYPDPLTSSGEAYGENFFDNNDKTNNHLNNELREVKLLASYKGGNFLLENKHLKIVNQSAPDIEPKAKSDSIFKFNRSEIGFEEVNALYHISRFADYIKDSIGFYDIMNYQIAVDVYALNGNDNSEFISSTNPPRLNFGQGGVDDAEDADILIHEYAHAISHSASPGSLMGYERLAMEEGFSDYWAAVYSRMLNEYDYKKLFNWDGHNEFWEGRSIDHHRKYSDGIDGNKYRDGEVFAAMLMDIREHIKDSVADRIILQSAFSWYPDMNFSNAIEQIMKADTLLYNSEHSGIIHWLACNRGFVIENCENKSFTITNKSQIDYSITHDGFISLSQKLINVKIQLFSMEGKLIFTDFITGSQFKLPTLSKGVYILKIDEFSRKIAY